MTVNISTLPSGLRVITDHVEDMDSVAVGVWCDVGTRHEKLSDNGVAHMVEHMIFKGTTKRTSQQIAEEIEAVGGQMNAYTGRDITAYYVHLLKEDMERAVDILGDMIQNSIFPEDEVIKERHVILQEIGMVADTPDDLVFDLFQEIAYPGQSLGTPILGKSGIVSNMRRETLQEYVTRFYTPDRLVISAAGGVDHDAFVKLVSDKFDHLPASAPFSLTAGEYHGGELYDHKMLEQSHVVLGFDGVARTAESYFAAVLVSSIMGGGMSSRLFQEIRENRGLAYSVYSHHSAYDECGLFSIYVGTGPDKLGDLMPVLCDEVRKIAADGVSGEELSRAKAQLKSNMLMSRESMLSRANKQAKHLIYHNDILNVHQRIEAIQAVSAEDIRNTAGQMFSTPPTLTILGPHTDYHESYEALRDRLAA